MKAKDVLSCPKHDTYNDSCELCIKKVEALLVEIFGEGIIEDEG